MLMIMIMPLLGEMLGLKHVGNRRSVIFAAQNGKRGTASQGLAWIDVVVFRRQGVTAYPISAGETRQIIASKWHGVQIASPLTHNLFHY